MTTWVLLVAPDRTRRRLLREDLERYGFAVEPAADVDGALATLFVLRPSMILIDDALGSAELERLLTGLRDFGREATMPFVTVAARQPAAALAAAALNDLSA
ncbi:MAG TPA: hypothetical protein VEU76_02235 [Candidatus Udaeobacter sp.]|nr:hypothetical protein [Candidatus Udaeobacter sp.]